MDEIGHLSPDIVDQETPQQAEQRFYKEKEKQNPEKLLFFNSTFFKLY